MNFRTCVPILFLAYLTVAVGCDLPAPDTSKKPDAKTEASQSASANSPSLINQPIADFGPLPATDPLIVGAIESREQLIRLEEELLARLDELRTLLAAAKADPARLKQSAKEFLDLAQEMRRVSERAGDSIGTMMETSRELARSMKHLASSYRAAAELFRKKSRDYSEPKLRDQLLGFANDFEQFSRSMPEKLVAVAAFQKNLPRLRTKVREANAFLDDVVLFLHSHPSLGSENQVRYATQFESFVSTFSEWLRTLEELRHGLRAKAVSQTIQKAVRAEQIAEQKRDEEKQEQLARQAEDEQRRREIESKRLESVAVQAVSNQIVLAHLQAMAVDLAKPLGENSTQQARATELVSTRLPSVPKPYVPAPTMPSVSCPTYYGQPRVVYRVVTYPQPVRYVPAGTLYMPPARRCR